MQAYLDDAPLAVDRPTLAGALEAGVAMAGGRGRVVVEVRVDGAQVSDAVLQDPPEQDTGEVRMVSVEPRSLVRMTLLDAAEALERAEESQKASGALMQSGQVREALGPLSEALGTWQIVHEAVVKTESILRLGGRPGDTALESGAGGGADGGAATEGGGGLARIAASLADRLREIKTGLEHEDWSAVADVLLYEMDAEAAGWKRELVAMAERLRPGDG